MIIEKGFVRGLVICIAVFICIVACPLGLAHAGSTTDGFSVLYSFGSVANDGANPYADLTLSGAALYGMTGSGGAYGNGTIFHVNTDGTGYQRLYSFGSVANDGAGPQGSLTLSGSTLYGMTGWGGAYGSQTGGNGTIFQINTDGTGYKVLYSFGGVANDGAIPTGSLTLSGSTLYGTTSGGGAYGCGTIFQINTDGTGYMVLYRFGSVASDGTGPAGSLTLSGPTLYGMTYASGANGNGAIFQINTDSTGYKVLYSFGSVANDGAWPAGSLTLSGSTLYGMTSAGGANNLGNGGNGTIFQINTNATGYQVLYSFGSVANDGAGPWGSLTLSGSTLYGMTSGGGDVGGGTIFQINTSGTGYQVLYNFGYGSDGFNPYGSLTLSGSTLYGMTYSGGAYSNGAIFSVNDTPAAPDAPTEVTAAAGIAQAAVSFVAPDGPPVSSYTVTSNPGSITATGAGGPIIVQGLTNGTPYTFTVTATNTIGTGPASSPSNSVTPYAVPPSSIAALAGTWNMNNFATGPDAPWWERGTVTVNPDGTGTEGTIIKNNGSTDKSSGGAFAFWSSPGGLFLTNGKPRNTLCQIDSSNTVLVCTETWSDGSPNLMIFTKQAASCSLADLTGPWEGNFLTASGQGSGTSETDSLTINPNGTWTDSTTGGTGTWSISSSGVITDPSDSTFSGVMGADKTVMVATSGGNTDSQDNTSPAVLGVYAKQAASYLPADLAGTWQGNKLLPATWERDTLTINQDGTFTVSFTASNGTTNSNTGINITGTATLSSDGAVTLVTNVESSQGSSQVIIYGDMAADKTVMVFTDSAGDIGIFTKSIIAVNGVCGSSNGGAFTSAPTTNLCSAGTSTTVSGSGPWSWTCQGMDGGTNASCSANVQVVNGVCGSSNGGTFTSAPTTNLCSAGTFTTVSGSGPWSWTCQGVNGGTNASCSAKLLLPVQQAGSLSVMISPAGAMPEGAMWNVDGGSWQACGATVWNLSVGSHTVGFNSIQGWITPSSQTVTITSGQTASAIGTYTPVFAAIFTASTTSGNAPLKVHFSNSSVGSIKKWLWHFGNGPASKVRSPSHTYSKAGVYTVTLTVTGAGGTNTCTQPGLITVYAAPKHKKK